MERHKVLYVEPGAIVYRRNGNHWNGGYSRQPGDWHLSNPGHRKRHAKSVRKPGLCSIRQRVSDRSEWFDLGNFAVAAWFCFLGLCRDSSWRTSCKFGLEYIRPD